MGRKGLILSVAAALLIPPSLFVVVRWITSPVLPARRPATPAQQAKASKDHHAAPAVPDPNLPVYVGETRRIAAGAIDVAARIPLDQGMVTLGHQFVGTPARSEPPGSTPAERLVLDLTGVDDLSFIEQLLALVNSRQVRTITEAVDRYSDHVRRLRYLGGLVERCARMHQPSLWALAAERHGYLVDLSRFLPGSRQRSIATAGRPASGNTTGKAQIPCPRPPGIPATLPSFYIPLAAVPQALPTLRSGDLFVLVPDHGPGRAARIGLVEMRQGRLGALLADPRSGVVQADDLLGLAKGSPGTVGLSFLRPVPNADGQRHR